jgi:hypothetical protein
MTTRVAILGGNLLPSLRRTQFLCRSCVVFIFNMIHTWYVQYPGLTNETRASPTRRNHSTTHSINPENSSALFLAVLSCFSPDFVLLCPHLRRDCYPTFVHLHGTPPSFGYGDIFGGNPDATSLRDTVPSSSCTPATPPLLRPLVLPHLLFGYGNIFGGYLDVTSLRDTVPSRSCTSATPLVGLRE